MATGDVVIRRAQIAGVVALAAIAAAWSTRAGWLWGAHAGAFLPAALRVALLAAAAAAVIAAPRIARALDRVPCGRLATAAGLSGFAALFWLLRERLYFLGDAKPMLTFYESRRVALEGHAFLTTAINYNLYRAADRLFGLAPEDVVAATSVVAGLAYVVLAFRATAQPRGAERGAASVAQASHRSAFGDASWIARALLLTSGTVAIFAGYVENYAFVVPAILLYCIGALDCARGRRGLAVVFGLLLLAMAFHFVAFTLIPSFAGLVLVRARSRREFGMGAAYVVVLVVAAVLLSQLSRDPGFRGDDFGRHVLFLRGEPYYRAFGFLSPPHLSEIANALALLVPAAIFLGVAALASLAARRRGRAAIGDRQAIVLGTAAAGALAFLFVFNAEIGVARDWDLFAFAAVPLSLLACALASAAWGSAADAARESALRAVAIVVAATQLPGTLAFVVVNHDADAGIARAEAIMAHDAALSPHAAGYGAAFLAPVLGKRGRWEEALPYYETVTRCRPKEAGGHLGLAGAYFALGRGEEGAAAARRALALDPREWRALTHLGKHALRGGRVDDALRDFEASLAIEPRDPKTLGDYGIALAIAGRDTEAAAPLAAALRVDPERADVRMTLAKIRAAAGHADEARALVAPLVDHPLAGAAARAFLERLPPAP